MTDREQIEEMARIISEYDECGNCQVCKYHNCCSSEYHATNLYNAGYRKQSENTVDVVRCKDCHWFKPYKKPVEDFDGRCDARGCETDEEEFCSYGARMKGGEE